MANVKVVNHKILVLVDFVTAVVTAVVTANAVLYCRLQNRVATV